MGQIRPVVQCNRSRLYRCKLWLSRICWNFSPNQRQQSHGMAIHFCRRTAWFSTCRLLVLDAHARATTGTLTFWRWKVPTPAKSQAQPNLGSGFVHRIGCCRSMAWASFSWRNGFDHQALVLKDSERSFHRIVSRIDH